MSGPRVSWVVEQKGHMIAFDFIVFGGAAFLGIGLVSDFFRSLVLGDAASVLPWVEFTWFWYRLKSSNVFEQHFQPRHRLRNSDGAIKNKIINDGSSYKYASYR